MVKIQKCLKKIKQDKGITLVALVITIIIIIILATVTINMAFGDNGLIKQAQLARDLSANSTIAEGEGINSLLDEFGNIIGEESGTGGDGEEGGGDTGDDSTIEDLENTINDLNDTIDDLNQQLADEKDKVANLEEEKANLEQQVEEGQATIEEQQGEIDDLNGQISDKNETISNLESTISSLENQVSSLNTQVANLQRRQATGTATASQVLTGYTFSNSSSVGLSGSMTNRGAWSSTINPGGSVTIPAGYHNGSGRVTANKLSTTAQSISLVYSSLDGHFGDGETYTYTAPSAGYYMLIASFHDYYEDTFPVTVTLGTTGTQIYKYSRSSGDQVYYYSCIIYAYLQSGQTLTSRYNSAGNDYTSMGVQVFRLS